MDNKELCPSHTHRPSYHYLPTPFFPSTLRRRRVSKVEKVFLLSDSLQSITEGKLFQSISYIFYSDSIIIIGAHNAGLHNCKFYILKD